MSLEELIKEIEADEANLKPINHPPKPSQYLLDTTPDDSFEQINNNQFIEKDPNP